jgi:hypothetical protein
MADDDDKPPHLKVVSDNPTARADRANAEADRRIEWAKTEAKNALSRLAATLLRTIAGSDSEALNVFDRLLDFTKAYNDLRTVSGSGLTIGEQREALRLPSAELGALGTDDDERRWLRETGMEMIVQGALRLAAHRLLDEPPAFGGMHSTRLIREGIKMREEARKEPVRPPRAKKPPKASASKWDDVAINLGPPEKPARKKPWSSRDSVSYRDLKPEDK